MVGASFAKGLALALDVPLIAVHHMQAHILAHFIDEPQPSFPFLCLTVSGGHTQIVKVSGFDQFKIIGNTLDDAAGEAFDKTAQLLGLSYPGGPALSLLAEKGKDKFNLPRPLINSHGLDFSFSGLKTAVLTLVKKQPKLTESIKSDIAFAFQESVTDVLVKKSLQALKQTNLKRTKRNRICF
jgi:N6-L-threonylcarbamoyladenine synthase